MLPKLTFVLGGAASGKSVFAERLVLQAAGSAPGSAGYIATAEAHDDEMRAKIAAHVARRDARWHSAEAPHDLPAAIAALPAGRPALVDCLTLWLSNRLLAEADLAADRAALLAALAACPAPLVVVSNEVGQGVVPDHALGRAFRSAQGALNAEVAARADCAVLVAAGLPLVLKGRLPGARG